MVDKILHQFDVQRNRASIIRGRLLDVHGRSVVDIREFYLDEADEWRPSTRGIRLDYAKLGDLLDKLAEMADKGRST